jgi:hypothetical protein
MATKKGYAMSAYSYDEMIRAKLSEEILPRIETCRIIRETLTLTRPLTKGQTEVFNMITEEYAGLKSWANQLRSMLKTLRQYDGTGVGHDPSGNQY